MNSLRTRRAIAKGGPREPRQASGTPLEVRFARTELSRQRRQLIRAILDNPEEAYFLSSRELARRYHVDAATIVRTIQALGYQRFADFVADLREHFVRQITPYTVAKAASQEKRSIGGHVEHGLDRGRSGAMGNVGGGGRHWSYQLVRPILCLRPRQRKRLFFTTFLACQSGQVGLKKRICVSRFRA